MISLKNNTINSIDVIKEPITKLVMEADIDATFFAILTDAKKIKHVYPFTKYGDIYKSKLVLSDVMIDSLAGSTLAILTCAGEYSQTSNAIQLSFDLDSIKALAKRELEDKLLDIKLQIASLTEKFNSLTSGKVLKTLNIDNLEYIKPGMIPVAIDDNGHFVAQYVFKDHIQKVNGKIAEDGEVVIEAKDIAVKNNSVEDVINSLAETIKQLHKQVKTLGENQKEIQTKLGELTIEFTKHISNGII